MIFDIGGSRKIAAVSLKGQNLLFAVAQCTAKKETGNPDKDPGVSSEAHRAMGETYATAYDGDLI